MPGPHRKMVTQEESATVSEGEGEGVAREETQQGRRLMRCCCEQRGGGGGKGGRSLAYHSADYKSPSRATLARGKLGVSECDNHNLYPPITKFDPSPIVCMLVYVLACVPACA